ncbi:hypothetical protein LX36DRAFT_640443 [Colletotrichum falcatum]|nr:hypothetical protein LX36DRAFT_640443 [Colletotrichum falcatum]
MVRISAHLWTTVSLSPLAAAAAGIVYVTDLSIYTLLAPCAQTALSYNIFTQTYSACGEAPTDLQSCICTKNNNLAAMSTSVSKSVSYSCGSTASDDQASAAAVLSQYCNPDAKVAFATPTTNVVTKYATDIAEFGNLAPCAQSGVSYALGSMTSLCPEPASLMAPCVCSRNDNSARVSRSVASLVRYSCSNAADVTSGLAFYDAYCAMNEGTTAFPQPSPPPGDMTYFMTAMSQYSSLAPCAQSGVSDALYSLARYQCPEGPKALASCICIKDGVTNMVTSTMASDVKYYCSSTASEDVSSALALLDFYCKAARNEVVVVVLESVGQTYATAQAGTGTGGSRSQPASTGSSGAGGGADNNDTSSGGPALAAIIGGVVAVVGTLSIGALVAFMFYRRRKNAQVGFPLSSTVGPPEMAGPPELSGTMLSALPPKSPQVSVSYTVSPQAETPPGQHMPSELQGQQSEKYGQAYYAQGGYTHPQGGSPAVEAPGQPVHQQQQRAELQGMGWHAGPTPGYSELEVSQQRR